MNIQEAQYSGLSGKQQGLWLCININFGNRLQGESDTLR
ncbi:hypothetical protein Xbed_02407 [Xenorhabdus beddingii]|uniref:Uncharacterized protein n=1 Tax=Xenorhabdus beddingii TaxID=40578 RepID=A0A1Y2SMN1_9GAMM|nr:hypothetical protein Xbed_02407 [Xenorhabdus beddingii]